LACALDIERAARCAHRKCGASAPSPSLKNVSDPLNGFFTTKRDAGERQEFDQRLRATRNNSTLRLADPRNLVVAILDGIGSENFPHRESMQKMPGFSDKLSDTEAATLANYLLVTWGGQKDDVTPAMVRALR
jgi:hypothetical protein